MILPRWCFLWLMAVGLMAMGLAGCSSIFPRSAPPVYYQLEYQPPVVHCRQAFAKGLRVWQFTSSSPYRRTEMVVLKPEGKVLFSSAFQWVDNPGTMVAESLQHDLTESRLFPQVVSANDPAEAPLELSGRVFVFAWERAGTVSRAALQVEVSLVDTEEPRQVVFRREYDLCSPTFADNSSSAFARAMSGLMRQFSASFQQDLCTAASSNSSQGR